MTRAIAGKEQRPPRRDARGAARIEREPVGYLVGEDVADRVAAPNIARPTPEQPPATADAPTVSAVGMASPLGERLLSLRRLRRADLILLSAVVALVALGLLMVYSASQALDPTDPAYLLRRQALSAALGGLALVIGARVDYHFWQRWARLGLLAALGLVALTLIIGREANGAQRWLGGAFSFQPSEPAKLALSIFLASWFAHVGPDIRSARRGLLPFVVAAGGLAALTLAQRDMGTTVVIVAFAVAMYFTAGARLSHLIALVGLGALTLGWLAVSLSYRRARLAGFLDPLPPGCDSANSYQVCQGLLSLGSGGVGGAGLGASVQKAGYLPFPQTDSIYAVLGGELGLIGCALAVGLLIVVVWRGYQAGRRAPDRFGALLACGIATWLGVQATINIGGVVAAIPFTGVPLPFISYGGAALVSELAGVGVLLNIYAQGAPLRSPRLSRRRVAESTAPHHRSGASGRRAGI